MTDLTSLSAQSSNTRNQPGIIYCVLRDAYTIRKALAQCERTYLETPLQTPVMPLLKIKELST